MSNCLTPDARKVRYKNGVRISDISSSEREFLDNVVSRHGIKISLIWIANCSLGFSSKFGGTNYFLGEPFKDLADSMNKYHILGIVSINLWGEHFILVKIDFSFVGLHDVVPVADAVVNMISHLLKLWNYKYAGNYFLV